jgi:Amt family ammonium transporter
VGGILGAILTGLVRRQASMGGVGFGRRHDHRRSVVGADQGCAVHHRFIPAILSFVILKIIDVVIGLRVTEEQETEGLDIALHDERGYNL